MAASRIPLLDSAALFWALQRPPQDSGCLNSSQSRKAETQLQGRMEFKQPFSTKRGGSWKFQGSSGLHKNLWAARQNLNPALLQSCH